MTNDTTDKEILDLLQELEREQRPQVHYRHKCQYTVKVQTNNTTPVTEEEGVRIALETIRMNPHYKLSFIPVEDFYNSIASGNCCLDFKGMTPAEVETTVIKAMEDYNQGKWTYMRDAVYCPYWQMSKDEYEEYAEQVLQQELSRLGYKK